MSAEDNLADLINVAALPLVCTGRRLGRRLSRIIHPTRGRFGNKLYPFFLHGTHGWSPLSCLTNLLLLTGTTPILFSARGNARWPLPRTQWTAGGIETTTLNLSTH